MKNIIKFSIFSLCGLTLYMCNKNEVSPVSAISTDQNVMERDSDAVCPIRPIDLNVGFEDGVMSFPNADSLWKTCDKLAKYTADEILQWTTSKGFTSLYSEYFRISDLSATDQASALLQGRNAQIMRSSQDMPGAIDLSAYAMSDAALMNKDGFVIVGNKIGTYCSNLSIWTDKSNKQALLTTLLTKQIQNPQNFIIYDDRFFKSEERDANANSVSCPSDAQIEFPLRMFNNSTDDRRVRAKWGFFVNNFPNSSGNRDYRVDFKIYSESYKKNVFGNWKLYKTDHTGSMDVDYTTFTPGTPTTKLSTTGSVSCSKTMNFERNIVKHLNVTQAFLIMNGIRLLNVNPGATGSGQTGTSVSHGGMNGEYLRFNCD